MSKKVLMCGGSSVVEHPLFQAEDGGSTPTPPLHAHDLTFDPCAFALAVECNGRWHSRLPHCQRGPWQYAFKAVARGRVYAIALWHNPSGRCLPHHWLELRRLACSDDAPRNTCSRFMAWMIRYFRRNCPERERCISYQDTAVHSGTIYRAAGWTAAYTSKPRLRDRSKPRKGTERMYRTNANGLSVDGSAKVRWEIQL